MVTLVRSLKEPMVAGTVPPILFRDSPSIRIWLNTHVNMIGTICHNVL